METLNPENRTESSPEMMKDHLDWVLANSWQYLSWIKETYGSIAEFQKVVSVNTETEREKKKRTKAA
jgi:hypothetical protein